MNIRDLPSAFLSNDGVVVSVLRFDVEGKAMDFIFSFENDDFESEFFSVKTPYRWSTKVKAEIADRLAGGAVVEIRIKNTVSEHMGKSIGRLTFLGFE